MTCSLINRFAGVTLAIACSAWGACRISGQDPPDAHLAVIAPAPPTAARDQRGRPFDLATCRGKVTLVSFVFTTCTGSCPGTTARLVQLQRTLKQAGLWGSHVRFVSITLDPERDSPDALREYATRFGADLSAWTFLTGPLETMRPIWRAWEMTPRRTPEGGIDHPSRIYILDPQGRIREIESLETLQADALVATARALLAPPAH